MDMSILAEAMKMEATEKMALHRAVVTRIKSMGLTKEEFSRRFNFPTKYVRVLGNPYGKEKDIPERAIVWLRDFVMRGENTPIYEKADSVTLKKKRDAEAATPVPVEGPIFPTMDEPAEYLVINRGCTAGHIPPIPLGYTPYEAMINPPVIAPAEEPTVEPIAPKKPSEKLCPKCGAKEHRDEAMFCYACGTALKTQAEFVIASLESIRTKIGILPSATKDEVRDILIMAVDYIKNVSEV